MLRLAYFERSQKLLRELGGRMGKDTANKERDGRKMGKDEGAEGVWIVQS